MSLCSCSKREGLDDFSQNVPTVNAESSPAFIEEKQAEGVEEEPTSVALPEKETVIPSDSLQEAVEKQSDPQVAEEELSEERTTESFGYTIDRQDYSVHTDNRDFFMFFDVVTFHGDEQAAPVVNQIVTERAGEYKQKIGKDFSDMSEYLSDAYPYSAPHYFEPREVKSIFFDERYISIGWKIDWYAGGVYEESWESVNISRETLDHISIYDILGENTREKIDRALEDTWASGRQDYDIDSLPFFFDAEKVYVGFGSGAFRDGPWSWSIIIEIPR